MPYIRRSPVFLALLFFIPLISLSQMSFHFNISNAQVEMEKSGAGDINGDQCEDLFYITLSSIGYYLGNCNGTFQEVKHFSGAFSTGGSGYGIDVRLLEMTGDSQKDFLVLTTDDILIVPVQSLELQSPIDVPVSGYFDNHSFIVTDFDEDGDQDILLSQHYISTSRVVLLEFDSMSDTFEEHIVFTFENTYDEAEVFSLSDSEGGALLIHSGNMVHAWFENETIQTSEQSFDNSFEAAIARDFDSNGQVDLILIDGWNGAYYYSNCLTNNFVITNQIEESTPGNNFVALNRDVDGDEDLDLIFGWRSYSDFHRDLFWYRNDVGSFSFGGEFNEDIFYINSLISSDIDDDGIEELLVSSDFENCINEYDLEEEDIIFRKELTRSMKYPKKLEPIQFNGEEWLWNTSVRDNKSQLMRYVNDTLKVEYLTTDFPYFGLTQQSQSGDLDNDGNLEFIHLIDGHSDESNYFIISDSPVSNEVSIQMEQFGCCGTQNSRLDFKLADLDGDGNLDLVGETTLSEEGNTVHCRYGNGDGTFSEPTPLFNIGQGEVPRFMEVAHMDGDTVLDLVLIASFDEDTANDIRIHYGGNDYLSQSIEIPSPFIARPLSFSLGDMNVDGLLDIVVSTRQPGSDNNQTYILYNSENQDFNEMRINSVNGFEYQQHSAIGDFDGDDLLDVIIVDYNNAEIVSGASNFEVITDIADGYSFRIEGMNVLDIDNDGDLDVALFDEMSGRINLIKNEGFVSNIGETDLNQVLIYPNPSDGLFNFKTPLTVKLCQVFDQSLRLVSIHYPNNKNFELDLSGLNPGMYFVTLTPEKGKVIAKKIVIR